MLPPELIKKTDDLMKADLSYWRDIWFGWLIRSTQIVVIGLVLEGPELVHEIIAVIRHRFRAALPEVRTPDWVKLVAFIGWILIVAGVAGEWVTSVLVSQADANIQTFNDVLLAETNRAAGDAKVFANDAASAAQRARAESDKAMTSASNALSLADGARKEADSFEKDIGSAKKQAADAESHLAEAMKRATALTAQLDRLTTPRSLPHSPQVIASLKPFKGTEYMFTKVCEDTECVNLLRDIDSVLGLAGWTRVKSPHSFPGLVLWGDPKGDDGAGIDLVLSCIS